MNDYWLGVLTPFALIGGLALALALSWLMLSAADWFRSRLNESFVERISLPTHACDLYTVDGFEHPNLTAANKLRDAVLASPRLHLINLPGWRVFVARDYRELKEDVGEGC